MVKDRQLFFITVIVLMIAAVFSCSDSFQTPEFRSVNSMPRLEPDYSDTVLPPNIAPLNFVIREEGVSYAVQIHGDSTGAVFIRSKTAKIEIPLRKWRRLLNKNHGKSIHLDVFVCDAGGQWRKYQQVSCRIADEPIDRYLVYRFLRPNYTVQMEMTLRQRDLTGFDDSPIMSTKTISACINCHNFNHNNPDNMLFHIRWGAAAGMLLSQDGKIFKINTKTDFNESPGTYPSWHPNGKIIAFSVNKVSQFFHASGESRDVIDLSSDIVIYKIDSNMITSAPGLSNPSYMETFPTWSPDGRYLYFCRAPQPGADFSLQTDHQKIKYDLMRLAYNPETETWGKLDTLISTLKTGQSCSHPRISPDGAYLLFCMSDYGTFPIFRPESDLYLMTLSSGEFHRLEVNSSRAEAYHSWSSTSRWMVFTSKRDNGVYTRLYFSYLDDQGRAYKPFILPQQDPELYETLFYSYSIPELITKPVPFNARQFIRAALDPARAKKATLDPNLQPPTTEPNQQIEGADYP